MFGDLRGQVVDVGFGLSGLRFQTDEGFLANACGFFHGARGGCGTFGNVSFGVFRLDGEVGAGFFVQTGGFCPGASDSFGTGEDATLGFFGLRFEAGFHHCDFG